MKKFIKILLYVVAGIAAIVVVLSFVGPKKFNMSRGILIMADKATVWNQVSLWEKHKTWSPWVAKEPDMKITIDGKDGEVGSKYSWESKTQGNGKQIITASEPMTHRTADMEFGWGMKSSNGFHLKDSAGGTWVSWSMYGDNDFFGRVMGVFMNFEKFVGPDYEQGLKNLKKICEAAPKSASYKLDAIVEKSFAKTTFVAIRHKMSMDEFEKTGSAIYGQDAGQLMGFIGKNKLQVTGTLFGLYYKWDDKNRQVEMAVAFPVASATKGDGNIEVINMNAAKCAAVDYWGDYSGIGNAHMELDKWLAANKKTSETPVLEEYIGDPEKEKDPMKVLTRVWYPLK